MAIIGFIVQGDRTSHGGVVISGDSTWTVNGQAVARIGDKVSCPRCKRISTIASSSFSSLFDGGVPAAYDRDTTDCGAVLYSRNNGFAGYSDSSTSPAEPAPVEDFVPPQPLRFQEHFLLRDSKTGQPQAGVLYTVATADGQTFEGETDAEGRTDVVWTDSQKPLDVRVKRKPVGADDPTTTHNPPTKACKHGRNPQACRPRRRPL